MSFFLNSFLPRAIMSLNAVPAEMQFVYVYMFMCLEISTYKQGGLLKVARDSCDVTHSLKQASIHTSHVHTSKSCTKYSLHLVQSTSTH